MNRDKNPHRRRNSVNSRLIGIDWSFFVKHNPFKYQTIPGFHDNEQINITQSYNDHKSALFYYVETLDSSSWKPR